ncbi:MAG: histidine phosphatase family protein [Hyphomicrobiaceae bacterium]|nr:histidine phosphatase family protein [Hyphomicrobiaceae bacterium]
MLTLSLLRHGKSSRDDPEPDDHQRPLASHGRADAEAVGAYIAAHGPRPELMLCSSAIRARQTLEIVLQELGAPAVDVVLEPALYLAPATAMLACLRQTAGQVRSVLLVGHNPGMHALALELTGSGLRRDIASMATKFPTCGLAVLTFETEDWALVRPAAGRLALFLHPGWLA